LRNLVRGDFGHGGRVSLKPAPLANGRKGPVSDL
jgi:hypothetical protein